MAGKRVAVRRPGHKRRRVGRGGNPEQLESRCMLSASAGLPMDLIDPSVRLSYLAAGEMGPLQIQSQAFDTSTAYEQVDTGWFWSVESGSIAVQTQEHTTAADQEEWLVRLTAESLGRISSASDLQAFLDPGGLGLDVVAGLGLPGLVLVRADTAITDVDSHLSTHSGVAYFEPNQDVATDGAIPDDPRFGDLYGLHNTGQSGGRVDADIDAVEAWQYTTGSRSIAVGVIDTGIDMTHPDLYRNVWINQAEIPSGLRASLSDVDGDGRITFVDVNAAANRSFSADRNGNGFIDARDLLEDSR